MYSEMPYVKIMVCTIIIFVSVGTTIVGKIWISNVFRNPDAADKGNFPAIMSLGALELILLISTALFFSIKP